MSLDKTSQYQAYNIASQTAPKMRQIVMLYDGAIRFMRQAKLAIEEGRIEDRYNLLTKASEVILGLQGCLDFERGGEVAQILYDYYSSLDARILSIHRSQSIETCDSVIADLKEMRDAWEAIEANNSPESESPAAKEIQEASSRHVESSFQMSV